MTAGFCESMIMTQIDDSTYLYTTHPPPQKDYTLTQRVSMLDGFYRTK